MMKSLQYLFAEMDGSENSNRWNERLSREFIDYGRYFVPERERQIEILVSLLPHAEKPTRIFELCCGEGLLAEAILAADPNAWVTGFDGSQEMLNRAEKRLVNFGERFEPVQFELADLGWREREEAVHGIVTSLAVHHLDGPQKPALFRDVYDMLLPGGVFLIADMIDPVHPQSKVLAGNAYDDIVRQRSLELDGNTSAFDFFQREGWNIFYDLDPEDIDKPSPLFDQLKWLEQADFTGIDVFWLSAGHAIFGGWKPHP